METSIVVKPSKSEPGMWFWAFKIDEEVNADGEAASRAEANQKARMAREEWEHRNDD